MGSKAFSAGLYIKKKHQNTAEVLEQEWPQALRSKINTCALQVTPSRCHSISTCPHLRFGTASAQLSSYRAPGPFVCSSDLGFFLCWKGNSKDLEKFHQYIKFPGSNVCPLVRKGISAANSSSAELYQFRSLIEGDKIRLRL